MVCGTNMKAYKNRCELDKAACEAGNTFEYAHYGPCQSKFFFLYRSFITFIYNIFIFVEVDSNVVNYK